MTKTLTDPSTGEEYVLVTADMLQQWYADRRKPRRPARTVIITPGRVQIITDKDNYQ